MKTASDFAHLSSLAVANMAEKKKGTPKHRLVIPLAQVRDEIRRHIEPELIENGFESLGDRRWVRRTKEPIREVVYLFFLKGYTSIQAGVVLAGAPILNGKRISVPKSPEASAFPVWLPPIKETSDLKAPFCAFSTQAEFKAEIAAYAPNVLKLHLKRFSQVTSLKDLRKVLKPASASALKRIHPLNREGTLEHGLTYIFTLSMLGERSAAHGELAVWCEDPLAASDQRAKLSKLIELSALTSCATKEPGSAQKASRQ
jgi:hypothetical protein